MFYSGSPILLNIVENSIVNPQSKGEEITKIIDGKEQKFFSASVYNNIPKMFVSIGTLFSIILCIALTLIYYGVIE